MATVKTPLGSARAQGSIGHKLTFYRRGLSQKARQYSKPTDQQTTSQQTQRSYHQEAVGKWQDLTEDQRQQWRDFVKAT